jgi:hypothetical protein
MLAPFPIESIGIYVTTTRARHHRAHEGTKARRVVFMVIELSGKSAFIFLQTR